MELVVCAIFGAKHVWHSFLAISLNLYAIWNQTKKARYNFGLERKILIGSVIHSEIRECCCGKIVMDYFVPVNSMLIRSMLIHLGFWKKKKIMFSHWPLMSNNTKGSQFHSNWIATRSSRPKQCPSHTFASEKTKIMKPYIEGGKWASPGVLSSD